MKTLWKDDEMFDFCTSMQMVLESGLSIDDGLEVVKDSTSNDIIRNDIGMLHERIKVVGSFSVCVKEAAFFDDYAKKMIEIGEVSGTLDAVMKELATYYERSFDLKQNLKEALVYPFILLVMMWCIVLLIIWKVLPIFTNVLHNMGTVLQGNATSMMQFGSIFGMISFVVLTLLLLVCLSVYLVNRKAQGNLLSHFFFTRKLYQSLTMAKMTYAFSLFMSSGYDVEEALSYLPQVIDHPGVIEKLNRCIMGLKQGDNFVDLMQSEHLYEGVYANMIYTGFRSGKSEDVLKKASSLFEKDVDTSISTFLNTIEPSVVIVLSVIVGVILLSVMLPLMSIMSSM